MTLLDLGRLIKKYWYIVLACTLVCTLAGAGYTYLKGHGGGSISATANIVGNSQVAGVMGLALEEGRNLTAPDGTTLADDAGNYELTVEAEKGTSTVSITVSGPDESECIALANRIANASLEKAYEWYPGGQNILAYSGHVEEATEAAVAAAEGGPSKKYILVALLAGLFLGVCVVVVIDMVRRPVKSIEGMQDAVELPVLEKLPAASGERLLANVRFAGGKDDLRRVCVVPLGAGELADEVAVLLRDAMAAEQGGAGAEGAGAGKQAAIDAGVRSATGSLEAAGSQAAVPTTVAQSGSPTAAAALADDAVHDNFYVQVCQPLSANMSAAYEARGADAAVVVARQWTDSLTVLETTVAELKLAGANVVGLVFAK